jgi:hypothetical protein
MTPKAVKDFQLPWAMIYYNNQATLPPILMLDCAEAF